MQQVERYRRLHTESPGTARGLGWGSERAQLKRFHAACEVLPLKGLSVLDVGCGYGDLVPFVVGRQVYSYKGIDLVPEYLEVARQRWEGIDDRVVFEEGDVLDWAKATEQIYDVVFALGTAGLADFEYLERTMKACYRLAKRVAVVSVTTVYTPGPTDGILTVRPGELAEMASGLTKRFMLRHDYLPTDQMAYLYRL